MWSIQKIRFSDNIVIATIKMFFMLLAYALLLIKLCQAIWDGLYIDFPSE